MPVLEKEGLRSTQDIQNRFGSIIEPDKRNTGSVKPVDSISLSGSVSRKETPTPNNVEKPLGTPKTENSKSGPNPMDIDGSTGWVKLGKPPASTEAYQVGLVSDPDGNERIRYLSAKNRKGEQVVGAGDSFQGWTGPELRRLEVSDGRYHTRQVKDPDKEPWPSHSLVDPTQYPGIENYLANKKDGATQRLSYSLFEERSLSGQHNNVPPHLQADHDWHEARGLIDRHDKKRMDDINNHIVRLKSGAGTRLEKAGRPQRSSVTKIA